MCVVQTTHHVCVRCWCWCLALLLASCCRGHDAVSDGQLLHRSNRMVWTPVGRSHHSGPGVLQPHTYPCTMPCIADGVHNAECGIEVFAKTCTTLWCLHVTCWHLMVSPEPCGVSMPLHLLIARCDDLMPVAIRSEHLHACFRSDQIAVCNSAWWLIRPRRPGFVSHKMMIMTGAWRLADLSPHPLPRGGALAPPPPVWNLSPMPMYAISMYPADYPADHCCSLS